MPWRIGYRPSPSGEEGVYPLRARYRGNLDIGFFVAFLERNPYRNRGPPAPLCRRRHLNDLHGNTPVHLDDR